eukprot:COSAG06_NODE_2317_length_7093_cov_3.472262_6_plen_102_part_00
MFGRCDDVMRCDTVCGMSALTAGESETTGDFKTPAADRQRERETARPRAHAVRMRWAAGGWVVGWLMNFVGNKYQVLTLWHASSLSCPRLGVGAWPISLLY